MTGAIEDISNVCSPLLQVIIHMPSGSEPGY